MIEHNWANKTKCHKTVLMIFSLIFQTITAVQMLTIGGQGVYQTVKATSHNKRRKQFDSIQQRIRQYYDWSCRTYKQEELLKPLNDPLVPWRVVVWTPCFTLTQVITQHVNKSLHSHRRNKCHITNAHTVQVLDTHSHSSIVSFDKWQSQGLTLSSPVVSNELHFKAYSAILVYHILLTFWYLDSGLSARVPECQKIKNGRLDQYGDERFGRLIFWNNQKKVWDWKG